MPTKITLKMDATKAIEAIDELTKLQFDVDINVFSQAINLLLDGSNKFAKLFCVKHLRTEGAFGFYALEPTKRLVDFLIAARAGDWPRLCHK
ncbi:hypothetical protein LCGC14_1851870 [marine sediment metagenome]|uniref:Uncharacterized protein n=1 Tax=marine sediment metagenome TaxID=412755 RepID=A0A0F9IPN3_9ZZZZ